MSRSNNTHFDNSFQDKIILEIEKYDFHLIRLDEYINEKINEHHKNRPDKIDSEGKFHYDLAIDNEIHDLIITNSLLYNNALISYYSFLEHTLFDICNFLKSKLKLDLKVSDIRGDNKLQQCRKYIEKVAKINFNKELNVAWQKIDEYRIIRNLIVHNLSNVYVDQEPKQFVLLSKNERIAYNILSSTESIDFSVNSGKFSVTIDFVTEFSRLVLSFLLELTALIFNKNAI